MKAKYMILLMGENEEDKKLYAEKFLNTIKWEDGWALDWNPDEGCLCQMNYERTVGFCMINYAEDIMKTPEYKYFSPRYATHDMSDADGILFFMDAMKLLKRDWQDEMRFRRWMYIFQKYFLSEGKITVMLTNYDKAREYADFEEICRPFKPLLELLEERDNAVLEIKVLNFEEDSYGDKHLVKPVLDIILKKVENLIKEQEKIYQDCIREERYYRRRSNLLDTVYKRYLCGGARTNEDYANDKREKMIDEGSLLKSEQRVWQNLYWERKRLEER